MDCVEQWVPLIYASVLYDGLGAFEHTTTSTNSLYPWFDCVDVIGRAL
jgi:hypothetical protein